MKKRLLSFCIAFCIICGIPATVTSESNIKITKTDIQADGVFNTNGYGSLTIDSADESISPKSALIDRDGNFTFPYKDTRLNYYCYDDVVSLTAFDAYEHYYNDEVGFYSLNGEPLFEGEFYASMPMRDGYAFVTKYEKESGFKSYLIDKTGNVALALGDSFNKVTVAGGGDYSEGFGTLAMAHCFSEGLLPCWEYEYDSPYGNAPYSVYYMDVNGNIAFTLSEIGRFNSFSEGLAFVQCEPGLFGYIDKTGNFVIPINYSDCGDFNDGLAYVSNGNKYGYINKNNDVVIPFKYDGAYGAGNGLASVVKDGKCGLVDYNNNVIVPLEYDDISSYNKGVAYAVKDGYIYIITGYEKPNNDVIIGDVNNDGTVSAKDNAFLARHLANWAGYEESKINKDAADVNTDGSITAKDNAILARHLANWTGYDTLPYLK